MRVPALQNDLAAYQFNSAVLFFGLTIKNAVQERHKVGNESLPKYTIEQLLDPDFRLPTSGGTSQGGLKALAAAFPGAVGRWKQVA